MIELKRLNLHESNPSGLMQSYRGFELLKEKYKWGANVYYHFASQKYIHPTYIQTLLSDERYSYNQIYESINFLSNIKSNSFDKSNILKSIYFNQKKIKGKWKATNWLKNKLVLIIGSGPSIKKDYNKIMNFINKKKPKVLLLNHNSVFSEKIAAATIFSHEARISAEINLYNNLKKPLIIPYSCLNKYYRNALKNKKIFDYSLTLKDVDFQIEPNGCTLKWPLAIAYALAIVTQANAKEIFLAGFDGYEKNDIRQNEMNDVFQSYNILENKVKINKLTKSTYKV